MADLKDEIILKIDQKFNELKIEFLSELKDQIKKEVFEAIRLKSKNVKSWNQQHPCCRSRTLYYRNRNKLKNAKVWLDLTKKRYKIFTDATDFVKENKNVNSVMVDI